MAESPSLREKDREKEARGVCLYKGKLGVGGSRRGKQWAGTRGEVLRGLIGRGGVPHQAAGAGLEAV